MAGGEGDSAKTIVAIFHASFHPTKGNTLDWYSKSYDGLDLDGVEFSVLPSGLHLVERDTVYFSHATHTGLALFRRRSTRSDGQRGFRLSSLGFLLQDSPRPRPWLHLDALRALADAIYSAADAREEDADLSEVGGSTGGRAGGRDGSGDDGAPNEADFELARAWFEERKASIPISFDSWSGWSDELDGRYASSHVPTHHLPHLLRILGLSSLTLYKFMLARRRVMIFTLPPVEVAGVLAWIASDLCREHQMTPKRRSIGTPIESLFTARKSDVDADAGADPQTPRVLGMVTLNDLQRLETEGAKGRGWIACTTDAVFLEKPQYYDLIIDLTTSTPSKASRPTLYMSKPVPSSPGTRTGKRRPGWKLESVRFTWSDVKLWSELDRILKLDSAQAASHAHPLHNHQPCANPNPGNLSGSSRWTDAFRLYEDVCLLCATLWMGLGTWRSNSRASFSTAPPGGAGGKGQRSEWGAVRLEGDDDWSMDGTHMRTLGQGIEGRREELDGAKMRNLGLGIEGRPSGSGSAAARVVSSPPKGIRKPSVSSTIKTGRAAETEGEQDDNPEISAEERAELHRQNVQTTLALLQTFHANTVFWLSKLHEIVPPPSVVSSPVVSKQYSPFRTQDREPEEDAEGDVDVEDVVTISSRDLFALELGVLSELDAKFVEWLAEAEGYASPESGRRIVVKRGWQELLGIVFGFR